VPDSKKSKAPSMVDVAREAGVALVTVSRVLNEPDAVRPDTRRRVTDAIARLGYRRNDVARALKSGRSTTIGVVIAGSELFELPRILRGVESAARQGGYWVNMASWQEGSNEELVTAVERPASQAVEGVAIIADRPVAAAALEQLMTRVPITVVMSGELRNPSIGSVELDQELGARLATEHLLDLGHRDIVHLTGPLDVFDAKARLNGWRKSMERAGVDDPLHAEGDFSAASGFRLTQELLTLNRMPTAIFAANDQMAMGVLSALAQHQVAIPEKISVVGFDDIAGSEYLVPSLTTVRQDFVALGRTSVELLLGMIGGAAAAHYFIAPTLIARDSSGPVPSH
jgi:DNA-binding LacI/PurR family transcriptional regulator